MQYGELRFVAVALVLHLTLPVAAAIAPRAGSGWRSAIDRPEPPTEIDIDLAAPPAPQEAPSDPPPETEPGPDTTPQTAIPPAAAVPPATASSKRLPEPPTAPSPPIGSSEAGTEPPPSSYNRPPVTLPGIPGGIPGGTGPMTWEILPETARRKLPGSRAPTRTPRRRVDPRAGTKALQDAIRAQEKKLGLDLPAASAIASVIRETVRASQAPDECSGSFSVSLNAQGKVTAVSLTGFSGGDVSTWQTVRKRALASLSARQFPLRSSFARGALVSVSVRSQRKMPGGGTSRKGLSLSFDASDIGARSTRVVSMSFNAQPIE